MSTLISLCILSEYTLSHSAYLFSSHIRSVYSQSHSTSFESALSLIPHTWWKPVPLLVLCKYVQSRHAQSQCDYSASTFSFIPRPWWMHLGLISVLVGVLNPVNHLWQQWDIHIWFPLLPRYQNEQCTEVRSLHCRVNRRSSIEWNIAHLSR
jgi:hypothetical protein